MERWIGRIVLTIIPMALVFGIFEHRARKNQKMVSSAFDYAMGDNDYFPRPFVVAAAKPGAPRINKMGYKTEMPAMPKPATEKRIFILGGSTVEGPPLDRVIQENLQKAGTQGAKVYNYGINSSISRQDIARIWTDIAGFEPDLILTYSGANDVVVQTDPRVNYPHRFFLNEIDPFLNYEAEGFDLVSVLMLKSQFIRQHFRDYLFERIAGPYMNPILAKIPGRERMAEMRARAYVQNLRWGQWFAQALSVPFVAAFQPILAYKEKPSATEKGFINPEQRVAQLLTREKVRAEAARFKDELDFYDLSDLFTQDEETIYTDDVHMREMRFHQRVGDRLSELVLPYIQGKKRAKQVSSLRGLYPDSEFVF